VYLPSWSPRPSLGENHTLKCQFSSLSLIESYGSQKNRADDFLAFMYSFSIFKVVISNISSPMPSQFFLRYSSSCSDLGADISA